MDKEVEGRFKTTFHAVQDHFTTVFKQLFGGGQAELRLTEDDYLSAGVDIIVQPPGKKLQHLSLLSGGNVFKCYSIIVRHSQSSISTFCYTR